MSKWWPDSAFLLLLLLLLLLLVLFDGGGQMWQIQDDGFSEENVAASKLRSMFTVSAILAQDAVAPCLLPIPLPLRVPSLARQIDGLSHRGGLRRLALAPRPSRCARAVLDRAAQRSRCAGPGRRGGALGRPLPSVDGFAHRSNTQLTFSGVGAVGVHDNRSAASPKKVPL